MTQQTGGEIVPFGKYKGQPAELLLADTDYCEWLTAQPWFRDRFRNVYNLIINHGGERQDSPEHNQMHAAFLDDQWCFALADLLRPGMKHAYSTAAARKLLDHSPRYQKFQECVELETHTAGICDRLFEDHGWDVVFGIDPAAIETHRIRLVPPLPPCTCRCDHSDCHSEAKCHDGGMLWCRHADCAKDKRNIDAASHCTKGCYWKDDRQLTYDERTWLKNIDNWFQPVYAGTVLAELKPDLGDDYPAVLRQVNGYPHDGRHSKRCVVVRRYAFEHVTWDQVQRIFAASGITLLIESEIAAE